MENKHTPGPWYPVEYAGFYNIQTEPYYSETSVMDKDQDENAEANAQLASCAPEMLEALEEIAKYKTLGSLSPEQFEYVEQLVLKAKGGKQ